MTRAADVKRLQTLAAMLRDLRLAELHQAAQARQASLDRLAGLSVPPSDDLPPIIAEQAALRYQHWADLRRVDLNLTLARQTADWMEKQESARQAFGRAQVLAQLGEKQIR